MHNFALFNDNWWKNDWPTWPLNFSHSAMVKKAMLEMRLKISLDPV